MSSPLAMTNIKRTDAIAEKERVVTYGVNLGGGFRSVFPAGIPVGRVLEIIDDAGATVKTALIQPEADLEHVEWVLVQTNFKPSRKSNETASE